MNQLSNIKGKLLTEQTADQIYQYILDKPVAIGQKLPNEFVLGEMFGVGRSTIREAVKMLISKGILEIRRGSGTYVINDISTNYDPLGFQEIADKKTLAMDLADVRMMLEPEIASRAAVAATKEDIDEIKRLCARVEEKILRGENYIDDDIAFHSAIAESAKNVVIEQLIPIIDTAVMMFVNVTHKSLLEETLETHRAITEAIESRDSVGARAAMMMHLTYNRQSIMKMIKK